MISKNMAVTMCLYVSNANESLHHEAQKRRALADDMVVRIEVFISTRLILGGMMYTLKDTLT
jgi:hypothetical protein